MEKEIVNLCVRVPKELRDNLKIIAIKNGVDLKVLVKELFENYVEENK